MDEARTGSESHLSSYAAAEETPGDVAAGEPEPSSAPGSPDAERRGCRCSFLLNRGHVEHYTDAQPWFVNPLCPVHGTLASSGEAPAAPST